MKEKNKKRADWQKSQPYNCKKQNNNNKQTAIHKVKLV